VQHLKFNGLLKEIVEGYRNIDLAEFLQRKLQIPEYKAKELAIRIEKKYCTEVTSNTKQNSEEQKSPNGKKLKIKSDTNEYSLENLSGKEFERFLKWLFEELGYEIHPGKYISDSGVDLVASKHGEKIVIQAKRYPKTVRVSNSVIQKTQDAMGIYGCKKSIVVTTSFFTQQAISDAKDLGVELWDKDSIKSKIDKVKKATELEGQSFFPKYKASLLQSLLSLEQTKDFIIERRSNGKYDLHLPGVKFPLLSFQARYEAVIRCVYRIKNNVPVGEFDGLALIKTDHNNRYGPDGERAYALIIKYLEEFIE
jgi:HJR/Mrr/RecB family endonuclease